MKDNPENSLLSDEFSNLAYENFICNKDPLINETTREVAYKTKIV